MGLPFAGHFGKCVPYQCNYTLLLITKCWPAERHWPIFNRHFDRILHIFFYLSFFLVRVCVCVILFSSQFLIPIFFFVFLVVAWIVEHMLTCGFANVTNFVVRVITHCYYSPIKQTKNKQTNKIPTHLSTTLQFYRICLHLTWTYSIKALEICEGMELKFD